MLLKASVWPEALGRGRVWEDCEKAKVATRGHMREDCKRCARSGRIGENCVRRMLLKGNRPGRRNGNGDSRDGDSGRQWGQRQVLGQQLGAASETAIADSNRGGEGKGSGDSGSGNRSGGGVGRVRREGACERRLRGGGALPLPKATTGMSEKRCGRVWGHGAPIVVEDEGEDQGSPRVAKRFRRSLLMNVR